MTVAALQFSEDQAEAHDALAEVFAQAGVDLLDETLMPRAQGTSRVAAVMGKAGSGKTVLLARIAQDLEAAGVEVVSGDFEGRRRRDRRQ